VDDEQLSFEGGGGSVTVPFNVKSSNLKVPVPLADERDITIVTVPVKLFIGFATFIVSVDEPVVGEMPDPTLIPLIVIFQF
jgi:hypothetical protein